MNLKPFVSSVKQVENFWANTRYIPRTYLLAILFILLNALDNTITYLLLLYGAYERNVIVAYLLKSHGQGFWLIDSIIAVLAALLFALMSRRYPICTRWILIGMVILTGLALAYDTYGVIYLIRAGVIII